MQLPIYFDSSQLSVLAIGSGASLLRKLDHLIEANANIKLIAPQADFKIVVQASLLKLKWDQREATIEDVYDCDLLLIGEDDTVNKKAIITHATENHIFMNVCGAPDVSTFHFPAILREGDLTISVSTGGTAPFMAVEMIRRLKGAVKGWSTWLKFASAFRRCVKDGNASKEAKEILYSKFITAGPLRIPRIPNENASIDEWTMIFKNNGMLKKMVSAGRLVTAPVNIEAGRPARITGFIGRSNFEAGLNAVETDDIPPPDEVGTGIEYFSEYNYQGIKR